MRWKGYIGSVIEEVLGANAQLRKRLAAKDDTYREIIEAMTYPGVPRRIEEAKEILG